MDLNINLNIKLEVPNQVLDFLSALTRQTAVTQSVPTAPSPEATPGQDTTAAPQPPQPSAPQEPLVSAEETSEVETISQTISTPKSLPTEVDIREAIERTRKRIEGEPDNADSEGYKKYHRQLTGWFKNTAALHGADKPSQLAPEKRADFISDCDRLQVVDGELTMGLPF